MNSSPLQSWEFWERTRQASRPDVEEHRQVGRNHEPGYVVAVAFRPNVGHHVAYRNPSLRLFQSKMPEVGQDESQLWFLVGTPGSLPRILHQDDPQEFGILPGQILRMMSLSPLGYRAEAKPWGE